MKIKEKDEEINLGDIMGLINLESGYSLWRGVAYYEEKWVSSIKQVDENIFESEVLDSNDKPYYLFRPGHGDERYFPRSYSKMSICYQAASSPYRVSGSMNRPRGY